MNNSNFNRRQFLQSAFAAGLVYGSSSLPGTMPIANAMPAPLNKRILVNLNLSGGPDLRHLVVPAYDPSDDSFGGKYWKHRTRSHRLVETGVTAQQRYEDDYVEFQVGNSSWNSAGLVDPTGTNSNVRFGIWREASWLIDMFANGNAAMVFSAVGGTNRAHDRSSLMLAQGDLLAGLNNRGASGWGGRLARSAGGKAISLTSSPSSFLFGPVGLAPNYDPSRSDNIDLRSISDSRNIGLYDFDINLDQRGRSNQKMARAAKSYYAALRQEQIDLAYQTARDHEQTIRDFGVLVSGLLNDENIPIPESIRALYETRPGFNLDPNNAENTGRRVLRDRGIGRQIRNLYDMIAVNNLTELDPRVLSMTNGGWDSHGAQRRIPAILATDPTNPFEYRGIESNLRDLFGGQFGSSPNNPAALHGAFSALWDNLPSASDRSNIAITIAGEFGRQIRDNGDSGTDHGKGNLIMVLGESVRGGVYGTLFQDDEVDKYDNTNLSTPDIDPLTEIDPLFSQVCDWVTPNSGTAVFPRTASGFSGEAPLIEVPGMFLIT